MKKVAGSLSCVMLVLLLTGCGTMRTTQTSTETGSSVVYSSYHKVVILDFDNHAWKSKSPVSKLSSTQFPELIAHYLDAYGIFHEISRDSIVTDSTLVVSGEITRYEDGNAVARALIGFGAGSSYFDAKVDYRCGASGRLLESKDVDRNSWVLGGAIAAGQTAATFMDEAAKWVAKDIYSKKTGQAAPSTRKSSSSFRSEELYE